MMRRVLSFAFVTAAIASATIVSAASPAGACGCEAVDDAVAFANADAVFIGQIIRTHPARDGGEVEVEIFTVSDVFKGEVDREQGIVTPVMSPGCGIDFQSGDAFIVFASTTTSNDRITVEDGFLYTEACAGTRAVTADTDLAFAGVPTSPNDVGAPSTAEIRAQMGDPRSSIFPEAFIFVGVLGFILALAAWFSRKNRPAT
jgi:hypothetical protein